MRLPFAEVVCDFPGNCRRTFARPRAVLSAARLVDVPDVLHSAENAARLGQTVFGFVSYEAAPAFDGVMRVAPNSRLPLAWFAVFDTTTPLPHQPNSFALPAFAPRQSLEEFRELVEWIRNAIACGQTYQVNLATRFVADFAGDALAFYESLRRTQGAGYHAYIDTGEIVIASASPELFFETRGRRIRTRPMKGTRPRGRWEEEDRSLAAELAQSEKERAENLMIVDLLRNDVGRVANIGSVAVTSLFEIERYRTVQQMTSTIEADLGDDVTLADIFAALFPCGSVTGAPKISTMEIITDLEDSPREVYCGAIGIIEPGGDATFNVPIRTVWIDRATGRATYGSGAGITFDSDAASEYAEVEAKAAVLLEAWPEFDLLETMRAERGHLMRVERHIARILASARYFDIPASEQAVRDAAAGAVIDVIEPCVIRLLIDQTGAVRAEVMRLETVRHPRIALARTPVSSTDRFLYHKTTHRRTYQERLAGRPDRWDVLLWNERGEVTEFTRGNVVIELEGQLLTPARACGLLPGTFRTELLEAGRIREAIIPVADLPRAAHIWLINSVREWVGLEDLRDFEL